MLVLPPQRGNNDRQRRRIWGCLCWHRQRARAALRPFVGRRGWARLCDLCEPATCYGLFLGVRVYPQGGTVAQVAGLRATPATKYAQQAARRYVGNPAPFAPRAPSLKPVAVALCAVVCRSARAFSLVFASLWPWAQKAHRAHKCKSSGRHGVGCLFCKPAPSATSPTNHAETEGLLAQLAHFTQEWAAYGGGLGQACFAGLCF